MSAPDSVAEADRFRCVVGALARALAEVPPPLRLQILRQLHPLIRIKDDGSGPVAESDRLLINLYLQYRRTIPGPEVVLPGAIMAGEIADERQRLKLINRALRRQMGEGAGYNHFREIADFANRLGYWALLRRVPGVTL